jgi:hypothetical protein
MHLCLGPGKNPFPVINRDGHLDRQLTIPFVPPHTANRESQPVSAPVVCCTLTI